MKGQLLLATVVATLVAAPAMPADLARKEAVPVYPVPPVVVAVYNWSGCYIGGQIGGQWGRWTTDVSDPGEGGIVGSDGSGSFIGGGQIGCNYQPAGSSLLIGVEGDVVGAWTTFSGEVFRTTGGAADHVEGADMARAACASESVRPGIVSSYPLLWAAVLEPPSLRPIRQAQAGIWGLARNTPSPTIGRSASSIATPDTARSISTSPRRHIQCTPKTLARTMHGLGSTTFSTGARPSSATDEL